ncbi:androgen-induced gene 1 protein-like isoform X1 [Bombus flavifrons]|uniref:androgen-induced gene 1 protein-like isoform X1 n=1 Tax=Bombus flavifrons TaxID=103934 RepID=UPI00370433B1
MVNWLFLSFSQSSYCIFIYPSVSTLQTVDAVDTIKCGLRKPKFPIFAIKKKIIRKYLSNTECLLCNNFNFLIISVLLSEIIQAIFFFICILNDWFGTNAVNPKKPPFIRKLKDHVHAILGFPIAMFVGIIFWTLMFVDRELVLPKALDPYFPWWLNHLMHTMIMVSTLIEMMIVPRKYPRKSFGLLCLLSFMIVYLIWVHIIFYKSGIWVYPILDVLPLPLRIVFFIVLLSISLFLYLIGEAVDNFLWGNEYTKSKKSYAKSK